MPRWPGERGESERNDYRMNSFFGFHQPTPNPSPPSTAFKRRFLEFRKRKCLKAHWMRPKPFAQLSATQHS
jgi:hypothetical protein